MAVARERHLLVGEGALPAGLPDPGPEGFQPPVARLQLPLDPPGVGCGLQPLEYTVEGAALPGTGQGPEPFFEGGALRTGGFQVPLGPGQRLRGGLVFPGPVLPKTAPLPGLLQPVEEGLDPGPGCASGVVGEGRLTLVAGLPPDAGPGLDRSQHRLRLLDPLPVRPLRLLEPPKLPKPRENALELGHQRLGGKGQAAGGYRDPLQVGGDPRSGPGHLSLQLLDPGAQRVHLAEGLVPRPGPHLLAVPDTRAFGRLALLAPGLPLPGQRRGGPVLLPEEEGHPHQDGAGQEGEPGGCRPTSLRHEEGEGDDQEEKPRSPEDPGG